MIDNLTAITYYNNMHEATQNIALGFAFIGGVILGGFVIAILIYYEMKQLRMNGRKLTRYGVYTFVEHTPETMKEYIDYRNKEKKLS